jgi:multidrug efflux system membrane fusion protein
MDEAMRKVLPAAPIRPTRRFYGPFGSSVFSIEEMMGSHLSQENNMLSAHEIDLPRTSETADDGRHGDEASSAKITRRHRRHLMVAGLVLVIMAASLFGLQSILIGDAQSVEPQAPPNAATPVSVAVVEQRGVTTWDEFSGRLEAIERVEIRSRVAGAVHAVHFREGALVRKGDLLITIDPAPFAAEVERSKAQVAAAQARLSLAKKEFDRGQKLLTPGSDGISRSNMDQRASAYLEAQAALHAAEAALQTALLDLSYTEIRAPVAGRMGKLEITVGNLVGAGPGAPVLTTLVSLNPIYASFNADEQAVTRALNSLGEAVDPHAQVSRIPVQMATLTDDGMPLLGRVQFVDNQFDPESGTLRIRAVFDNADGRLIPGQFARLRLGRATTEPLLLVSERAVGTDQNKKFVLVVEPDNKVAYREITLGRSVEGLRIVTAGLKPGERVIVSGLQHVRPGALVAPEIVAMTNTPPLAGPSASSNVAQR